MKYKSYITSQEWRSKHPQFLKQSRYRCSFFPWVQTGKKIKGKYQGYAIHHCNYQNLGNERL